MTHAIPLWALPLLAELALLGSTEPARATLDLIPASSMFGEPALRSVEINPSGSHVAAYAYHEGDHGVLVQELETGVVDPVFGAKDPIVFGWVDDDTLIVVAVGERRHRTHLVELTQKEWELEVEEKRVQAQGLPLFTALLAASDDELLWITHEDGDGSVYRLPTSELVDPKGSKRFPDRRFRIAKTSGWVDSWIADRSGAVRAALVIEGRDEPAWVLRYRAEAGSRWRDLSRWEDPEEVAMPVGIASNDRDLLVLSRAGRDKQALVAYLVEARKLGEVIYANPGTDVVGVLYDYHGSEVQAVVYEKGGLRRYHHLKMFGARQQEWLEEQFPGQSIEVTSLTRDHRLLSVLVTGPRNPGNFYVVDVQEERAFDIGKIMPWLSSSQLVGVRAIELESADGTRVEAFLALPREFEGDLPPLVVMPHGGPIGVRDDRDFNPDVQYLAGAGFAVLTVNYRGSGGYGREFLEAGRREWSEGIEDDIDAAVDRVIAEGAIDPKRMCIAGASYGGYSALISVTRRPQRYRCAASFAGPTDILLLSNEFAGGSKMGDWFAETIGNPETERERLIHISPAYRAAEIDVPVFIAHGSEDEIVDVDHAYRMRAMLEASGKELEWLLLQGVGHSLDTRYVTKLYLFLNRHLNPQLDEDRQAGSLDSR